MNKSIKVLIIDDSALVRQTLTEIIQSDPLLQVIGVASDPYFAAQKIRKAVPDVITLDIEMPRMDGLTFLRTLMAQFPVPVVIISSLTQKGSNLALQALDIGAVEIVAKLEIRNTKEHLNESKIRITDAIKAAYMAPVKKRSLTMSAQKDVAAAKEWPGASASLTYKTTDKVVAIGASTGGTEAIRYLLKSIPSGYPGILIVQHMPPGFTKTFAENLDTLCDITVKEAVNGERIMRGHAYVCPGGYHMTLERSGAQYHVNIRDGALVNRHRPSVDVLFESVAKNAGRNAMGIIMTGMGKDGAFGLLQMKKSGAVTIAQDEKSCVIFGMPKEAIKLDAATRVVPLDELSSQVLSHF